MRLAPAILLVACADPAVDDWTDQLVAGGPCHRADLLDGLDEETSAELLDVYGCVNRTGNFDALAPVLESLEAPTATGSPAWREVAVAVNALSGAGVDPFALAGVLLDALRAPERPLDLALDVALEAIYGVPAVDSRAAPGSGDPGAGLITPLGPLVPPIATALLADDRALATWAAGVLGDDETRRWILTLGAFAASADPTVAPVVAALPADLAVARDATLDSENDRWTGSTGDSLRDAVRAWTLAPEPALPAVADETSALLADAKIRTRLQSELVRLAGEGTLGRAADGAGWMASVDSTGGSLTAGEDSALHAFVRLLADTNQPMDCSVDLVFFDLEFGFGNLAVATLELVADLDPGDLQTAGSIYGLLFGNDVGEFVLEEAADLGVCPGLTRQVVDDLAAVEVLAEPEAADLLAAFVAILDTLEEGTTNQIPTLADLADDLYGSGAWPATEELLRDLSTAAATDDLIALLPALADPASAGLAAGDQPAIDLQEALDLVAWATDVDPATGSIGFDRVVPLLTVAADHDATWLVVDRTTLLLRDPRSTLGSGAGLVTGLLAADPELVLLETLTPLVGDPALAEPILRVAEAQGVAAAILAPTPAVGQDEAPLGFAGRLTTDGTLEDVLLVLDLAFALLGDPS
jgi:hypothetical protein